MILDYYLENFSFYKPLIREKPLTRPDLIVTVPVYNEEEKNISDLSESLLKAYKKEFKIEIIFLINEPENEKKEIIERHKKIIKKLKKLKKESETKNLRIYSIYLKDIPLKKFGIGYARKVLCDEAIWRFKKINNPKGIISCLDADCVVEENYFEEIIKIFNKTETEFSHIYFEHPYNNIEDEKLKKGIIYYELFLRFYKNSLLFSDYPYVSYTIGSCLVFRAETYARFGGFKAKRKAGEDFYFVQKILPNVKFTEITETKIFPSARISERVPFGTGKALKDFMLGKEKFYYTIPFEPFRDLKHLKNFIKGEIELKELPLSLRKFLLKENVIKKLREIERKTCDKKSYVKKFYLWFNLLKVWRYLRFCVDKKIYQKSKIDESVRELLKEIGVRTRFHNSESSPEKLLEFLRKHDIKNRIRDKNMFNEFYKKWIRE